MEEAIGWVSLDECGSLILLICLLGFIGKTLAQPTADMSRRAKHIAAAMFVFYAAAGIAVWGIPTPTALLVIVTRAFFAAGIAFGTALIFLPIGTFLFVPSAGRPSAAAPPPAPRIIEIEKIVEVPVPAPPEETTAADRAEAAASRYRERLAIVAGAGLQGMEAEAAREKAKQQYLRELDGILE